MNVRRQTLAERVRWGLFSQRGPPVPARLCTRSFVLELLSRVRRPPPRPRGAPVEAGLSRHLLAAEGHVGVLSLVMPCQAAKPQSAGSMDQKEYPPEVELAALSFTTSETCNRNLRWQTPESRFRIQTETASVAK